MHVAKNVKTCKISVSFIMVIEQRPLKHKQRSFKHADDWVHLNMHLTKNSKTCKLSALHNILMRVDAKTCT